MTEELVDRSVRCRLFCILKRLEGQEAVIMRTVGGFQFDEGRLVRVDDGLATATDVEAYLPGDRTIELNNLTVNLCAVFSIGVDDEK